MMSDFSSEQDSILYLMNGIKIMSQKTITKVIPKPLREPDYISERGVGYWWSPEWVRNLNGTMGKIQPLKKDNDIELHMLSQKGSLSYIQGRIQKAFKQWHIDRQIDYMLLGVDEEELIKTDWM